jgi:hypothetical protein
MTRTSIRLHVVIVLCVLTLFPASPLFSQSPIPPYPSKWKWDPFLDTLQRRTLDWFLQVTPASNGLTPDRWPASWAPASIAATGFGLTAVPVAVERGILTRDAAADRVLAALNFFWHLPQGDALADVSGYKGFFYHFLDRSTGHRTWKCELSTVDTGLLMAGVLFCQSYFDGDTPKEKSIRAVADSLYRRVDWLWFTNGTQALSTGWYPDRGFNAHAWTGYNEAMILMVVAMGSPTHPIPDWYRHPWYKEYRWDTHYGIPHLPFGPLFGHQFSASWIDFRGIRDPFMWGRGIDYFENGRRATYAQRAYAIDNPRGFTGYGKDFWGLTACDGPKDTGFVVDGTFRQFWSYRAREVSPSWIEDDGTLAPPAVGGSIAFAPEICVPALKAMRTRYGTGVWREYGMIDAFNPTYRTPATPGGWFDNDYIGIDQGPIALMIENLRDGFVWNVMKKNPYIRSGLRKMGFSGGWLDR